MKCNGQCRMAGTHLLRPWQQNLVMVYVRSKLLSALEMLAISSNMSMWVPPARHATDHATKSRPVRALTSKLVVVPEMRPGWQ